MSNNTTLKKPAFQLLSSLHWSILPISLAIIVAIIIAVLYQNQPKPKKRTPSDTAGILVDTIVIAPQNYRPKILSYGLVQPHTRSKLIAQVSGRVEFMSERFREGGFFKKDDLLLKIESTDYEITVHVAEANLADAERQLQEEIAEVEQAKANWIIADKKSAASPLTLREPQLKAASAQVKSQKAQLKQARVNLARTEIRAPFDGRVLTTDIDFGQVASNNSTLGEVYATDTIEISLPVKNNELPMLNLPETYSHQDGKPTRQNYPKALIYSELAGTETWKSRIIRTSGSIDENSRQLHVFARIEDPFGQKAEGRFPLKIGQYVTAEIEGKPLSNIITIPNKAIYQGAYVYTYKSNAIYRRPIKISWQNSELSIIASGLSAGDALVVSPLGQVASGTVARTNEAEANTKPDVKPKTKRKAKPKADNT